MTAKLHLCGYATPIVMTKDCVTCHNDRPREPGHNKVWSEGDIRGVQEIVLLPGGDGLSQDPRHTAADLSAGGAGSPAPCWPCAGWF